MLFVPNLIPEQLMHRLNGHPWIWIPLLLLFTLVNTHHQIQQQIQIGLYAVLMAVVRLGFYYYLLQHIHTGPYVVLMSVVKLGFYYYYLHFQIGLYAVLMAVVRLGFYYYYLHFLTLISRFNSKFR